MILTFHMHGQLILELSAKFMRFVPELKVDAKAIVQLRNIITGEVYLLTT